MSRWCMLGLLLYSLSPVTFFFIHSRGGGVMHTVIPYFMHPAGTDCSRTGSQKDTEYIPPPCAYLWVGASSVSYPIFLFPMKCPQSVCGFPPLSSTAQACGLKVTSLILVRWSKNGHGTMAVAADLGFFVHLIHS